MCSNYVIPVSITSVLGYIVPHFCKYGYIFLKVNKYLKIFMGFKTITDFFEFKHTYALWLDLATAERQGQKPPRLSIESLNFMGALF